MDQADIENRFSYHPLIRDQAARQKKILDKAFAFAKLINELTPDSREKSLAVTHVEDAVMWCNAAIARNESWVNGSH